MEIEDQNARPKRPVLLLVLSMLSLFSITSGLLRSVFGLTTGPLSEDQVNDMVAANMWRVTQLNDLGEYYWSGVILKIINLVKYTNANFYMDCLINLGAYIIGLVGVLFMLRGRKNGFHLYIVYNLIVLVSIYASAPASEIPSFYFLLLAFMSMLFIFLYSRTLKFMK